MGNKRQSVLRNVQELWSKYRGVLNFSTLVLLKKRRNIEHIVEKLSNRRKIKHSPVPTSSYQKVLMMSQTA